MQRPSVGRFILLFFHRVVPFESVFMSLLRDLPASGLRKSPDELEKSWGWFDIEIDKSRSAPGILPIGEKLVFLASGKPPINISGILRICARSLRVPNEFWEHAWRDALTPALRLSSLGVVIVLVFIFVEVGLLNCINCNPVPRGARNHPHKALWNSALTSADSGLQLDLGDRAKRCLSEGSSPCGLFSRAEGKLKRRMT